MAGIASFMTSPADTLKYAAHNENGALYGDREA
jgi:hypothetical protein